MSKRKNDSPAEKLAEMAWSLIRSGMRSGEIERETGLSHATLNRYMNGYTRQPTWENFKRLERLYESRVGDGAAR